MTDPFGRKTKFDSEPLFTTEYKVECIRCGVLYAFTHTKGDPPLMANWIKLHQNLSKHDDLSRLHYVRFTSREIPIASGRTKK